MKPFTFEQATTAAEAARAVARRSNAMFLAGGTTLVDLMKIDVLSPDTVIHVGQLALADIEVEEESVRIGANVRNNQLAWHPVIRKQFPVLSEALLSGATTQLRNMATVAGNIMQRTRCPYFRDVHSACNRRVRGSGCDAMLGSIEDMRYSARAIPALRHIRRICVWRWLYSMPSFTLLSPTVQRAGSPSTNFIEYLEIHQTSKPILNMAS